VLQLARKVFKKVHRKYADVTEQQVSDLLEELLQEDRSVTLAAPQHMQLLLVVLVRPLGRCIVCFLAGSNNHQH
jgi:hypothetical protein